VLIGEKKITGSWCGAKLSFVNVYSATKKLKGIYAVNLNVSLTKNTYAEVAKERN
jgi:hypothetical protein